MVVRVEEPVDCVTNHKDAFSNLGLCDKAVLRYIGFESFSCMNR